ncbi:hypothetical protein ACFE04_030105 [Oxalis oulophora]
MENDDESATQDGPGNPMVIDCTETVIGGSKLDKGKAKIEYDAETGENLTKDATPGPDTKFFDNVDLPSGVEAAVPWLMNLNSTPKSSASVSETNKNVTETVPVESKIKEASTGSLTTVSADSSSSGAKENENTEVVVRQVKDFKQFDTVEDFSDHHYSHMGFKEGAPPKEWAKKIQAEWKILEKNLPDTIFVRVSESRMELLRAVIMGPDGTPYHDGLFVFDCFFPPNYPAGPPYFEDLVAAHFYSRARDILLACKAYTEGALVGSIVVKDGVVTTSGNQKITKSKEDFKAKVGKLMNVLATNFIKNGSTDLDEFGPA